MTAQGWRTLLLAFVGHEIGGPAFEQQFLQAWRVERDAGERGLHAIDQLFYEVDAYCADPTLAGEGDIDEAQLRREAVRALERLDQPWPELSADREHKNHLDDVRRTAAELGLTRER